MAARKVKRPFTGTAPDHLREAVLQGLESIERGDFIELHTEEDRRRYFSDIIERGKMRLAAEATPAGCCAGELVEFIRVG